MQRLVGEILRYRAELGQRRLTGAGRRIVLNGALELCGPPQTRAAAWPIDSIRAMVLDRASRLDASLAHLRDDWVLRHPGEWSGQKFSLRSVRLGAQPTQAVRIILEQTEWKEVRALHEGLERDPSGILWSSVVARALDPTRIAIPNIAVVHCVCETSDHKLVLAQRSRTSQYHPLSWTASYEEGIETADTALGQRMLHTAVSRGSSEELFAEVEPEAFSFLAVVLEIRNLNPAFVLFGSIPMSAGELAERHSEALERQGAQEVERLAFVSFSAPAVMRILMKPCEALPGGERGSRWHPTALYRLALAAVYRFGEDESLRALKALADGQAGSDL